MFASVHAFIPARIRIFVPALKAQVRLLLRKKEATLTFLILFALCLSNYLNNVLTFQGYDTIRMIHPMKLLLLSYNRVWRDADATIFFIQLYPFLVVCPAGFARINEQHARQESLMISRLGFRTYYFSKLTASFLVTAIVFTLPFLTELSLNCIAFPLTATGDLSLLSFYNEDYRYMVQQYWWSGLYLRAPYLYTVLCTLLFGMLSGVLGAFATSVSFLIRFRFRALLFLPVFLLLNATVFIRTVLPDLPANWYLYFLIFCDEQKNYAVLLILLLICGLFIITAARAGSRKEVPG